MDEYEGLLQLHLKTLSKEKLSQMTKLIAAELAERAGVPVAKKAGRPTKKAPADFLIDHDLQQWARENVPGLNIRAETESFRDYTFPRAISDWAGAWRNWMRKAARMPGAGTALAPIETLRERAARERAEAFAPGAAAKAPASPSKQLEVFDVVARELG